MKRGSGKRWPRRGEGGILSYQLSVLSCQFAEKRGKAQDPGSQTEPGAPSVVVRLEETGTWGGSVYNESFKKRSWESATPRHASLIPIWGPGPPACVKCRHQLVCAPKESPPRSGLWTSSPSLFVFPSLFLALTPLFPLHPRNAPVTPLFPAHTRKQGGGVLTMSLSVIVGMPTFLRLSPQLAPVCKDSPIPLSFPVECQPKVFLICPPQRIAGEANGSCST